MIKIQEMEPEPIDFIKIEPLKNINCSNFSKSSAIFHPAKSYTILKRLKKNKPLLSYLLLGVFITCIIIVLILIPVYLAKSEDSLDSDFELIKNVGLNPLQEDTTTPSGTKITTEKPKRTTKNEATQPVTTTQPHNTSPQPIIQDIQVIDQPLLEESTRKTGLKKSKLDLFRQDEMADNLFGFNAPNTNRLRRPKKLNKIKSSD